MPLHLYPVGMQSKSRWCIRTHMLKSTHLQHISQSHSHFEASRIWSFTLTHAHSYFFPLNPRLHLSSISCWQSNMIIKHLCGSNSCKHTPYVRVVYIAWRWEGEGEGVSQFKWGSAPKRTQPGKESKEKRPKRDNKRVNEYKKWGVCIRKATKNSTGPLALSIQQKAPQY